MKWEVQEHEWYEDYLVRAKVPGGWLVRFIETMAEQHSDPERHDVSMTFVPDPGHTWDWSQP